MWFDGQRQPETIYVANTSRGKDSTAMLRAIQLMGWPLDMIVSVDVWATQDIPAELPPMVAFKDEYDKKVLDLVGIPVTRLCATRSQTVQVERERERGSTSQTCSTQCVKRESSSEPSPDSQCKGVPGANISKRTKLTYEDIFYRIIKRPPRTRRESTDSQSSKEHGASHISSGAHSRISVKDAPVVDGRTQAYGFPISPIGNWCTRLKTAPL